MRHTGAGLAIPTFPLAYGRLVPPLESLPVALHFAHRVGAVVVAVLVATVVVRARRYAGVPEIRRLAALLGLLVVVQIALGGWVILSYKAAWVTTAHLGLGALLFAVSLTLALVSRRRMAPAPAPAHPPIEPRLDTAVAS